MAATLKKKKKARTKLKAFGSGAADLEAIRSVSSEFGAWKPAPETLRKIEAVPTIFPWYNVVTGVGGHPTGCLALLHGPSGEGKTSFMLGLGKSYLMRNHFFGLVDAERTTPDTWVRQLFGSLYDHPGFVLLPTSTYEEVSDAVRDFCRTIAKKREAGSLPADTTALIVIDSLRKLFPKDMLKNLLTEGAANVRGKSASRGVDGYGGRGAQIKAKLNSAWTDELIPMLADTNCSLIFIGREIERQKINIFDSGPDYKVLGGTAVNYDATLRIRVKSKLLKDANEAGAIVGERLAVEVHKTKLMHRRVKTPTGYFHTSNGTITPLGFDRFRDVLDLAIHTGVVEKKKGWHRWGDEPMGNGEVAALKWLISNPKAMLEIENRAVASGLEMNPG